MHKGRLLQNGMHKLYAPDMGGKTDGFVATGVIEIVYEDALERKSDRAL